MDIARERGREITTTENAKYDTDTKNINQINSNYSRPAHDTTSTGRPSSTGVHVCGCASAQDGRKWTLGDYCCRSPAYPPNSTTQYYSTPKQQTIGPYPFSHLTEIPLGSRTLTVAMLTQYLLKAFSRATFFPRSKKKNTQLVPKRVVVLACQSPVCSRSRDTLMGMVCESVCVCDFLLLLLIVPAAHFGRTFLGGEEREGSVANWQWARSGTRRNKSHQH